MQSLLDLQAGAAGSIFDCDLHQVIEDMPNFDHDDHDEDEDEDEANVNVEVVLKRSLQTEVASLLKEIGSKSGWQELRGTRDEMVCPFCPKRSFRGLKLQGSRRMRTHLLEQHGGKHAHSTVARDFVASGSKQYQLVRALYDQQVSANGSPAGLLQSSAKLMRDWLDSSGVVPEGMATDTSIDRKLALCLTGDGPKYLSADLAKTSGRFRAVGYLHYDREFAAVFFSEMVRCKGKAKTVATSLIHFFLGKGCPVVFLLPRKVTTIYLKLMEDLMRSPVVEAWKHKLLDQCLSHREFVHVAMDATVRMAMRLKGQANYRQPKAVRDAQLVGDEHAKRRILTVRGRTGAVLCMQAIRSEAADDLKDFWIEHIPANIRNQVEYVASDQPSLAMLTRLSEVLPSLKALYLDEVHLCIVWSVAFWRKSSPGQQALRRVQAKFNKVDTATPVEQWGHLYKGRDPVPYSDAEEQMRTLIMSGAMSPIRAASVLNNLDDEKPWYPL